MHIMPLIMPTYNYGITLVILNYYDNDLYV